MDEANVTARVVAIPPASPGESLYPANRQPLAPSPLIKLPIGSITPKGWLRRNSSSKPTA